MHLFLTSAQARNAADGTGIADERIRDGDVLVACDDQVAAIMTYGTPYAITPQIAWFVSPVGIDWGTSLNGTYAQAHAYAQAALRRPAGSLSAATPNLARGVCVWCFASHRDPVTVHPYDRRLISTAMEVGTSNVSCAEVNAWLWARRRAVQPSDGDRRGCSDSLRRPSAPRNGTPDLSSCSATVAVHSSSGEGAPSSVAVPAGLLNADDTYHLFTDALRHPYQRFAVIEERLARVGGQLNGEVTAWSVALTGSGGSSLDTSSVLNHDVILKTLCRIASRQGLVGTVTADLVRAVLETSDREVLDDQLCLITAEAAHEIVSAALAQLDSGDSTSG